MLTILGLPAVLIAFYIIWKIDEHLYPTTTENYWGYDEGGSE